MSGYAERVTSRQSSGAPLLSQLDIELTERCNNDCIHCCINLPSDDAAARQRELTGEQLKKILTEAADLGCLQVRFTGGEPLLRPDFEDLYLFTRRLGIKVLLYTNARLVTERLASLFARIPPLVPIEITVYGMRPESYDAVSRIPGSYAQFRRGVDLLLAHRVPLVVKTAVLPPNRAELDDFDNWAAALPWTNEPPGRSVFFDLRNRRDDSAKNELIQLLRPSPEEGLSLLVRDPARYHRDTAEFASKFMRPPGDKLFACGAGCRGGCVDAYGRFQPCMSLRDPKLSYDLLAGTLREALTEFFPCLGEIRASNPDYLSRCARCFLKGLCEQCPAKSWSEHGTLDTPVGYLCGAAHATARFLGLLEDGERAWDVLDYQSRIQRLTDRTRQKS